MKKLLLINFLIVLSCNYIYSQCADTNNIYSFTYNGKTYEVVKENKTWADAAACAVERGGILAEINDSLEQDAIYNELSTNAGIVLANTTALDGGNASYVWLGGNDLAVEGNWVWDGNNMNATTQFWMGNASGNPVGGLYSNWGNEPDNFNNFQHCLGLALTQWPINSGSLGSASQWNDINESNDIYYIIEYGSLNVPKNELNDVKIFPNPVEKTLNIINEGNEIGIKNINIINQLGQRIVIKTNNFDNEIDVSYLLSGLYFIELTLNSNQRILKKFIKK